MKNERRISLQWDIEEEVLKQVRNARPKIKPLTDEYVIRTATVSDITALISLFATVFSTYPTPLNDADYLRKTLDSDSVFKSANPSGENCNVWLRLISILLLKVQNLLIVQHYKTMAVEG